MNGPQVMTSPLFLGIDTGGTYTDAVLYSESEGVLASAKALTTRHDLAIGVAGAVETGSCRNRRRGRADLGWFRSPPRSPPTRWSKARAGAPALVMIGFLRQDLARDGLAEALGSDPVIHLPGGT
jgi:hypothetical protein